VGKNINTEAPLKFKGTLEVKISKIQAHYTKNNIYALKKVLKVRR
jgi:hypothetical protein